MSGYDDDWHRNHRASAMPREIYDEFSASIMRGMGWDQSADNAATGIIGLDDQPCSICGGAGELRDPNPYGGETISTCTCGGTGSRASLTISQEVQHFEHILRTITGLAAE